MTALRNANPDLTQAIQQEIDRRSTIEALRLLKECINIVEGGLKLPPDTRGLSGSKPYRPGYVKGTVELLRKAGHPMKVADIARAWRTKNPDTPLRREALERSFWTEVRKKHPALEKLGKGYYWIKGESLPKGWRRDAAA